MSIYEYINIEKKLKFRYIDLYNYIYLHLPSHIYLFKDQCRVSYPLFHKRL